MATIKKSTIDLQYRNKDLKFISRLIWQKLFDVYKKHEGPLDNLDSMLCDLYTIERCLERNEFPFYWSMLPNSDFTSIVCFNPEETVMVKVCIRDETIHFEETSKII